MTGLLLMLLNFISYHNSETILFTTDYISIFQHPLTTLPLRGPKYHLIETIRPLIEAHWGVAGYGNLAYISLTATQLTGILEQKALQLKAESQTRTALGAELRTSADCWVAVTELKLSYHNMDIL